MNGFQFEVFVLNYIKQWGIKPKELNLEMTTVEIV